MLLPRPATASPCRRGRPWITSLPIRTLYDYVPYRVSGRASTAWARRCPPRHAPAMAGESTLPAPRKPISPGYRGNEPKPCYVVYNMQKLPNRADPVGAKKANVRNICYSVTVMRFQLPNSAPVAPEIPPIAARNTPLREKNIGRHWTTLGDIGGHMSPFHAKTGGFRSQETMEPGDRRASFANTRFMGPTAARTRIVLRD